MRTLKTWLAALATSTLIAGCATTSNSTPDSDTNVNTSKVYQINRTSDGDVQVLTEDGNSTNGDKTADSIRGLMAILDPSAQKATWSYDEQMAPVHKLSGAVCPAKLDQMKSVLKGPIRDDQTGVWCSYQGTQSHTFFLLEIFQPTQEMANEVDLVGENLYIYGAIKQIVSPPREIQTSDDQSIFQTKILEADTPRGLLLRTGAILTDIHDWRVVLKFRYAPQDENQHHSIAVGLVKLQMENIKKGM